MDIFEELKEYKKLLDADIITQTEFDLKKAELLEFGDKTGDSKKVAQNALTEKQTCLEVEEATIGEKNEPTDVGVSEISNSMGVRKVASILCLIGFIVSIPLAAYALYYTFTLVHTDTISTAISIIEIINAILVSIMMLLLWRLLRKRKEYISNTIGSASLVCFGISGLILLGCIVLVLRKMLLQHPSLTFDIVEVAILTIAFFIIWRKTGKKNN